MGAPNGQHRSDGRKQFELPPLAGRFTHACARAVPCNVSLQYLLRCPGHDVGATRSGHQFYQPPIFARSIGRALQGVNVAQYQPEASGSSWGSVVFQGYHALWLLCNSHRQTLVWWLVHAAGRTTHTARKMGARVHISFLSCCCHFASTSTWLGVIFSLSGHEAEGLVCHSSLGRHSCAVLFCHSGQPLADAGVSALQLSGVALIWWLSEATWLPGNRLCELHPCSFAFMPCLVFFIWPNVFFLFTFTCTTRSSLGTGT